MIIYGNICNFIKNSAKEITSANADNTLKEIKYQLSLVKNSNEIYTTVEKNTISIVKKFELEKNPAHKVKNNKSLDQQCIESIMKINNLCKNKDINVIKKYNTLLNTLEKEQIKKTSQESEISKKEIIFKNKESLFNKIKGSNEKLKEIIDAHYQCFQAITKEIENIDDKNITEKINEYNKYKSEILEKINNHKINNEKEMGSTELRQYIKELQQYDNNLDKFIESTNNITHRYKNELDILSDKDFKLSDGEILKMVDHHVGKLKEMNLQIN
ncbi:hypothetical protein [Proteus sp. CD3]|uniref:hypothetical protein n=1 Tax=Proteus sp. CD3 TaxID=1921565 RepID=UPI00124A3F07|nr:hypothetical protein [Proteus sp. CD3]QEZ93580.1 hypothetical protein BTA34_15055 [Proteus sp. CD3]